MIGRAPAASDRTRSTALLTPRQADVLSLVAEGLSNNQVGRRLNISGRTVNKHLEHLYAKTGARNRTEAAMQWREWEGRVTTARAVPMGGPRGRD